MPTVKEATETLITGVIEQISAIDTDSLEALLKSLVMASGSSKADPNWEELLRGMAPNIKDDDDDGEATDWGEIVDYDDDGYRLDDDGTFGRPRL